MQRGHLLVSCMIACATPFEKCSKFGLLDKARGLIKQFPAFYKPDNWQNSGIKSVDLERVHNDLIAKFKEVVDKYAALAGLCRPPKQYFPPQKEL